MSAGFRLTFARFVLFFSLYFILFSVSVSVLVSVNLDPTVQNVTAVKRDRGTDSEREGE